MVKADASTTDESIPEIADAYILKYGANTAKSCPNLIMDEPPVAHDVNPLSTSALVIVNMESARTAKPLKLVGFIFLAPSINGFKLSIKADRFSLNLVVVESRYLTHYLLNYL